MAVDFVKQTDKPLFPEVFWDRPTMKRRAGRLLIIGGHKNEFSLVQAIYQMAEAAGIGECQVAVPDSLYKLVGDTGYTQFLPTSSSGSLGKAALGELLAIAPDFDGLVIGANLTTNSETAVMIESLIRELNMSIIITEEAIELLKFNPDLITGNPRALVVATMPGLFALANHHHMPIAIRPGGGVVGKIEILKQIMSISKCVYFVFDQDILVGAEDISLTQAKQPLSELPGAAVGVAATLWLQNQSKPFIGLSTAAYILSRLEVGSYNTASNSIAKILSEFE